MAKLIPLTQEKFTIVDDEDFEWLMHWKWYCDAQGYAVRTAYEDTVMTGRIWMHREIVNASEEVDVDHRDGNPLNNLKDNLRLCTHRENMFNKKSYKNSTSHYKGVSWRSQNGKWLAQIQCDKKKYFIGHYDNQIEAAIAYNAKAIELFGEFARLNDV